MGLLDQFKSILSGGRTDVRAKYELLREVESGTMSKFYKARDKQTGKLVGLKILDPKKTADFEARFKGLNKPTEGEILAKLNHPRIVKLIEHGLTAQGERFVVMEFIDGQGVDLLIIGRSPLLNERRLPIIRQAAEAVQAVHDGGFIHRDVCPRNFMVDPQGDNVKLIDFGLTVPATAPFMQPGNRTGNPNYMAPELVKRRPTDPRLDQFAFGVSAYEILTGQLPWTRGDDGLVAMKHAEHAAVEIERYRPKIEPRLAKAIMRTIEREPEKRFANLNDFLKAIAEVKSVDVAA
ncbi:MAG TPA: serine/threonine-protein kinase [Pirellulales bacterium]|nr:serine/threonine-protein kinase [Pirellulales bacterium]